MSGVGACTLEADLAASFLSPPHRAVARQVLLAMTWRRDAGGPARLAVTASVELTAMVA
jgi:hypothetical protein